MKSITVDDICTFIYKCIKNKEKIYYSSYGGFVIPRLVLEIQSCWYSNLKQIQINYNNIPHGANHIIILNDLSDEDIKKFEKAKQAVISYCKESLTKLILEYD